MKNVRGRSLPAPNLMSQGHKVSSKVGALLRIAAEAKDSVTINISKTVHHRIKGGNVRYLINFLDDI
ncbi:unnamed protein product [Caenorhabditis bovis]|uniref:Uncharacterized protein n=1 Tax=Caenorhabditis bovis TaxID=2654633 RepID=A0A8S1F2S7_9PELO|nr:unnamed protein product [Caenorhabditis bovis]